MTQVWVPEFACPECEADIPDAGVETPACVRCGLSYTRHESLWRFLSPTRSAGLEPFVHQYRLVREREGLRACSPDYYRGLPSVSAADPHAGDWGLRRETYRHLLSWVLALGPGTSRVLDLGAGSAWLSHRLAALGHQVVAVDALDDESDGLGAARHYPTPFAAVQADFDALPFRARQFDLVVFSGSLHYARDTAATLVRAYRMLAPGGVLAVMDSPMFHADRDGRAMVRDKLRRFESEYGIRAVVQPGAGYLTFRLLASIADALQLRTRFIPSRGSIGWRLRRQLARLRLGRAPAAFGLWVAR